MEMNPVQAASNRIDLRQQFRDITVDEAAASAFVKNEVGRRGLTGQEVEVVWPDHLGPSVGALEAGRSTRTVLGGDGTDLACPAADVSPVNRRPGLGHGRAPLTRRTAVARVFTVAAVVAGWLRFSPRSAAAAVCTNCNQCKYDFYECYWDSISRNYYRWRTRYKCASGYDCWSSCGRSRVYDHWCNPSWR